MVRLLFIVFILTVLCFRCTDEQVRSVSKSAPTDSIQLDEEQVAELDVDCVFDTSTYKFTTAALFKYSPKIKYRWDTTTSSANVRLDNGDSLRLHIGGCNHFGFQASLLTSISYSDTVELFTKTQWLAKTFFYHGFDKKIPDLISKGHIKLNSFDDSDLSRTYTFEDPDTTVTNLILDGFSFEKRGDKTFIDLMSYIN